MNSVKIVIKNTSIVNQDVDAVVNPANSGGYMGGGVAGAIKKVGGTDIEDEAILNAPINVGKACLTTSGDLPCGFIIHAPTVEEPGDKSDAHKIKCAVEASLELADSEGFFKLAFPGMGTGVGGVSLKESAKVMIKVIKEFEPESLIEIRLVDLDEEMVDAWKEELEKYDS